MIQARCRRRLRYQFKAERGWRRRGCLQQIGHTPLPIAPRHRSESNSVGKLQHHRTPGSYIQIIKNLSQRLRTTAALTRKKPMSNRFNTRSNNRNTYHISPRNSTYIRTKRIAPGASKYAVRHKCLHVLTLSTQNTMEESGGLIFG